MAGHVFEPGQVFGLWTVRTPQIGRRNSRRIVCSCDCGAVVKEVLAKTLLDGSSTCCGCIPDKAFGNRARTHGMTKTREYASWKSMHQRTGNPVATGYENYGGRGIKVCEQWASFESFLADMGPRPAGKSLDRIDVNGDYSKENCRWATNAEQHRNRRDTKLSPSLIRDARARVSAGEYMTHIAKQIGCSATALRRAVLGIKWVGV